MIRDVSPGLCALIGAAEFLAPVPDDELSDVVRFTVTIDADEKEFEPEDEYRVCFGIAEGALTLDEPEDGADVAPPWTACILAC